ncbi:MAG TPA: zinc-ribbon domain-containing protein [Bacteroidales bacterium]|nr:zinc-ribbon domain-containing protein [Bacteroidales bacterium]
MICKNCQTENSDTSVFCIKCGTSLVNGTPGMPVKSKYADTVIIIISIFLMVNKLFWLMFKTASYDNWRMFRHFGMFSDLLFAAIPLLLAFIVKNKVWRILLIISGGIYALISLINTFSAYNSYNF